MTSEYPYERGRGYKISEPDSSSHHERKKPGAIPRAGVVILAAKNTELVGCAPLL